MRLTRHLALLSLVFISWPAPAQQYPTRAIRVLIPFTAGSAAYMIARAMEPTLRDKLGQSLVIANRGGAGGNIAAELTAKSAPDGYTIMIGTIGTHAINYSLYSKLPFHPIRDFTPVAITVSQFGGLDVLVNCAGGYPRITPRRCCSSLPTPRLISTASRSI